jgi:hypothetical protein
MNRKPPSDEQRQRARDVLAKAKAERAAQRAELAPGVFVYPDSPPGVGWVLERPAKPLRFYGTREEAVAAFDLIGADA